MRRPFSPLVAALLVFSAIPTSVPVTAAAADPPDTPIPLEEVLVTGHQPGPGLWRVTRPGDPEQHELWIFGNYSPLPRRMNWRSAELEAVLGRSQLLLAPPEVDASVGPLGGITLLPSAIGLRRNPDGARLEQVVPPAHYERWRRLKARYLPDATAVERWRPIFAAQALYLAVLDDAGLVPYDGVWPGVRKLARRAGVRITTPTLEVDVERPREILRAFKHSNLDDQRCFERTLDRIEADVGVMQQRAAAWTVGDIARLQALAPIERAGACIGAILESGVMRERGYDKLPQRIADVWLAHAERALAANRSTVAVLPVDEWLKPNGYAARLRQAGFVVDEP